MKASRKVDSLIRRNKPFFALTYDWNKKSIDIINTFEEYKESLENLKEMGMCKRCEWIGPKALSIGDTTFDVTLVSFGDIRSDKFVYGESPISTEFGVCMFDYVFMFVTNQASNIFKNQKEIIEPNSNK